ncbi:bifunctional 4-hydroxy-2-oxoglutarate aldolase/2-dehydro-3-deoxy-phosphogluconate aldolase [Leptolyngbya sp. FACHB-36]|uniref:bifunctional 4-hydroxy-2-oxoglutarate aldolase/2-dehydro-3-deoxy-phosphogluconate aldolase n=1 Tax=Leptolyngbya sp. FACHB-36 TaxID=2692808 RepID=UPI0016808C01|nr:bifunctional 4-hydroxy-2-oxoglutarate aldolase/2-dehydro-3-deoxy-phosphogluconate aldolase [Leptolyngbya sp. FACHB-36]MBD2019839.1 bifunctional 4-hydroxy-2-oxoglutarate aldolase/2-dehydro-3-deoxy-phosphogluconate aldolase [Leptolyngbya sp. FACHB-36]
MNTNAWLADIQAARSIAVLRAPQFELGYRLATAVAAGGMRLIEITWNSDRPAELISQLRADLHHCQIGAGTLLNRDHLKDAIAAGAQFLFTPHVDVSLIQLAADHAVPIVPGALSPTEIVHAWQAGATCVKVFPVQALGGADYIRSLRSPLDDIPLIPTGGVTLENAPAFLSAGAVAVGLSGDLFPKLAVEQSNWEAISDRARMLVQSLQPFSRSTPNFM